MFTAPLAITFLAAMARLYPYDGVRQDIYLTPMIYVLMGLGFDYILRTDSRRAVPIILLVILGLSGFNPVYRYLQSVEPENIRPVVRTLETSLSADDRIYVYYGANLAFKYYVRNYVDRTIYGVEDRNRPENYFRQLDQALERPGRIWLVFSHCYNEECKQIADHVARQRKIEKIVEDEGVALYRANALPLE